MASYRVSGVSQAGRRWRRSTGRQNLHAHSKDLLTKTTTIMSLKIPSLATPVWENDRTTWAAIPLNQGDLEGFILVEHRRHRTTGVPVLLTPTSETQRVQQQNPLRLSAEVNTVACGTIIRHRFTARGGLLLEVAEVASVNKLLQVRTLGNIPIQVAIPSAHLQNFGMIRGVPLWHTGTELAEFLQPEGVIAARRRYRRRGKPGGAAKASLRVILTFRSNTERPSKVNLGFTRHDDCKGEAPVKCANCSGEHPADYSNCKVHLAALKKTKTFVRGPPPIRDDPPSQEFYPPLPPRDQANPTPPQQQLRMRKNKTKHTSSNKLLASQNTPPMSHRLPHRR
ncbi:hypothetical protein HPB47_027371 [Ixodes persulcatus]|uniref:Uncharacterized protein n=1 Tax=Ixodes persulcatus TaxID=34615 RepID=A0AC60PVZ9_IXOPE|nr:hypothetical protein HPB47_027371 [Ixodes persulcatus]